MPRLVILLAIITVCAAVIVDINSVSLWLKVLISCVAAAFAVMVAGSMLVDRRR